MIFYNFESIQEILHKMHITVLFRLFVSSLNMMAIRGYCIENYREFIDQYNEIRDLEKNNENLDDIEEIDLSNNKLKVVTIKMLSIQKNKILPKKIIVSNNKIENLAINDNIHYLDISNNLNINPEVLFAVEKIDTLIQTNNPKKLKTKRIPRPKKPIICF